MLLKIGAWALGGGLLLMGLGIVAFNTLAQDWVQQELVPQVEAGLSRSLGYPVVLGPVQNLSPWGVQLGPSRGPDFALKVRSSPLVSAVETGVAGSLSDSTSTRWIRGG